VSVPLLILSAAALAAGKAGSLPSWQSEPYLTPEVGLSSFTSGGKTSAALSIGAQAGLRYVRVDRDRPWINGRTRLAGAWLVGSGGASGYDARLGSFLGPKWEHFGVQAGPDLFTNQYQWGGVVLDPTLGVGLPVTATQAGELFTLSAGVEPAWLSNEDRRVDWDAVDAALPGFGHEFAYRAGVGVSASFAAVSLSYLYRITAGGVEQGFGLGLRLRAG
jgi:hypothetical protein